MKGVFAKCAATLLVAAPCLAHTASDPAAAARQQSSAEQRQQADSAFVHSKAHCAEFKGARADDCAAIAKASRREQLEESRAYVSATSTRLRNRAYLRAAARYCNDYSGRVRSVCVDEATAMFGR